MNDLTDRKGCEKGRKKDPEVTARDAYASKNSPKGLFFSPLSQILHFRKKCGQGYLQLNDPRNIFSDTILTPFLGRFVCT